MKYLHPDTNRKFRTRAEAQSALKTLSPDLVEPIVPPRPNLAANETAVLSDMPIQSDGAWAYEWLITAGPITGAMVDAERDRRIDGGFTWQNKLWQSDVDSRENINGAYSSALAYLLSGGQPDEVYWSDPNTPLTWLAEDNSLVTMTPAMMIDFGNAALAHKKAHIFAARVLKDMDPIPTDFADDKWWP